MALSKFVDIPSNAKNIKILNYIGGKHVPPVSGQYLQSYNPATGDKLTMVPDSSKIDIDNAVFAAKKAFPAWSTTSIAERAAILNQVADLIEQNMYQLGRLESQDQGKPVAAAVSFDIPNCADKFRKFAKLILDGFNEVSLTMETTATKNSISKKEMATVTAVTQHIPAGVAGLISPWNMPLQMACSKIAPCIAVGNTCVVKPTEITSVTAFVLTQILEAAGVPPGVVNIVFGTGINAGEALVKHKDVRLISFTGGSLTGSRIGAIAGGLYKRVALELGGKGPSVVFKDCDIEHTITTNVRAAYQNQGELCLCASRQYVQQDIYDEYLQKFRQKTLSEVVVGNPADSKTFYGPMVSKQHMEKVLSYIRLAQEEGATVEFLVNPDAEHTNLSSDGRLTIKGFEGGYYIAPTLITNVKQSSRLVQEEIFGPVVCVMPFQTEDEAVKLANDTQYGLTASVWTLDKEKLLRVMKQINAGSVWGNGWLIIGSDMPFGGMGCSGTTREGGKWCLDFYTETKALYYPEI
ncbi:hypothetical protein IWW36_004500 [Coemansia brasiliensis]|uniref:Aldehyde dehydrogenase domain-containing protein n=1 Tax=Coemansia brasiliensis TaxID=2650707 RepID=A0A9W8I379_9FUNG|nr:hypothetical protein IWW36_004500 [Coemansia brasiliensis]